MVTEDGAEMCEVWFNVLKENEYREMLAWLTQRNVQVGLHHWGLAQGTYKTNLMTANSAVRQESLAQIRRAIEIGSEIGAVYVNIHPGAQFLEKTNFETDTQHLVPGSETPAAQAEENLLETVHELNAYARQHGVLLTVETQTAREAEQFDRRQGSYDPHNASLDLLLRLGESGIALANDLTHTVSHFAVTNPSRDDMMRRLREFTTRASAVTRLIHVNTVREPFDGRDSHDGLLASDFAQGFFPSRAQLVELLGMFRDRADVFVVVEPPLETSRENFLALREIAEEAGSR